MERKITTPYWGTPDKKQIICKFEYSNGEVLTASVSNLDGKNPDWKEIMDTFTKKEIAANTKSFEKQLTTDENRAAIEQADKDEKAKNEELFQAKIDAFKLQEVKDSKNKKLKAKIRKATSLVEVYAYAAAVVSEGT